MKKILIVEDDTHILTGLVDNLSLEGYATVTARDGQEALAQVRDCQPDLMILDIMIPKLNGFEVCKKLKEKGDKTPVIILSAGAQESDKVLGLELGADDYVTKPFSPRELLVRVKAVLRRTSQESKTSVMEVYKTAGIEADFKKYLLLKENTEIQLTAAEWKILRCLVADKGEPVSRHKIISEIWTSEDVTTRTVDTHIWNLREKLEKDPGKPAHILTVHRIGYKWVD